MKKILFVLAAMLTIGFSAKADHDQVVTFNQLPAVAQTMLKQYFVNKMPLVVTMDWDDYTIMYETGEKVEFEQIKNHVRTTFPGTTILKLDRNRRGYEIKLNNGLDIEYNRNFQVVEIDD